MININVFSEERAWSKKLKKKEWLLYWFISEHRINLFSDYYEMIYELLVNGFQ